jgi:lipoprotein-releasing system ATP-binding protein
MNAPQTFDFARTKPVLQLVELERSFHQGGRVIHVLRGASAEIYNGEIVALVGPSGSGKSSLLHMVGLLERPGGGSVILNGVDCTALSDSERTRIRRTKVGFVYQSHNLLPDFTAEENVMMPQRIAGVPRKMARERAHALLTLFSLQHRLDHRPSEMSGGEQQRVAIARAMANEPTVLLADEPTGNLDPNTAEHVFDELLNFVRSQGVAALIATHNFDLARRMDRILMVEDGVLLEAEMRGAANEPFAGYNGRQVADMAG